MLKPPMYDPRDYPVGLGEFLRKNVPPELRSQFRAAVRDAHVRGKEEDEWVRQQLQGMQELPDLIYKYIPYQHLDYGLPTVLRATQPSSLNDVMEANISTASEGKVTDRDAWYELILERLRDTFGHDILSDDEMKRRKNLYGDPRVSTIIRDYLSGHVGVVSFSDDPKILTMWAHYSKNSGFVIGYRTAVMRELGVDLRRVLYSELAPTYKPGRDSTVRLRFVDQERRRQQAEAGEVTGGIPLLRRDVEFFELRKDWRELAKVLFVKGDAWRYEQEVRLLVDLEAARATGDYDEHGFPVYVVDFPAEAIEEVYVGVNAPQAAVKRFEQASGVGEASGKLRYTDPHAYRM